MKAAPIKQVSRRMCLDYTAMRTLPVDRANAGMREMFPVPPYRTRPLAPPRLRDAGLQLCERVYLLPHAPPRQCVPDPLFVWPPILQARRPRMASKTHWPRQVGVPERPCRPPGCAPNNYFMTTACVTGGPGPRQPPRLKSSPVRSAPAARRPPPKIVDEATGAMPSAARPPGL